MGHNRRTYTYVPGQPLATEPPEGAAIEAPKGETTENRNDPIMDAEKNGRGEGVEDLGLRGEGAQAPADSQEVAFDARHPSLGRVGVLGYPVSNDDGSADNEAPVPVQQVPVRFVVGNPILS